MSLILVGLSHKTAPLELRERLAIPVADWGGTLDRLRTECELSETVLLSTCNRVEVYARPKNDADASVKLIRLFFENIYKSNGLSNALYSQTSTATIQHLFRVAAGLDSMVVGESEILGQVKASYLFSQNHGSTGKITNVLFQRALFAGKQIRTRTRISEGSSSVGSIAVQLAERIFGSLNQHRILILGAGKMAELTARHLLSQKAGEIVVINRTFSKAEALAQALKGAAAPMEMLESELLKADIVIGSVTSNEPIVSKAFVESLMKKRRERSLYFVDIAVPRNVEPSVHEIDNVYVYNIDDLKGLVEENLDKRRAELSSAEAMVSELAEEFSKWAVATLAGETIALKHAGASAHLLEKIK